MSRTIRKVPSSGCYMKQQHNHNYRVQEESAIDRLQELNLAVSNRLKCWKTRIADPWDDYVITHYRGQKWHLKNMEMFIC